MYSFSYLEPVCCSMSSSNCCFLTCIQISQEAGQVVWYSHFFQNFPKFLVIHAVKGFGIVNKAEIDFFWNSLAFSVIQRMLAIWSLVPLPFWNEASQKLLEVHGSCLSKPLTVWITINCGKFWKRWEYQTTWPASWESYMQVRKQQLELDMEKQTGSK